MKTYEATTTKPDRPAITAMNSSDSPAITTIHSSDTTAKGLGSFSYNQQIDIGDWTYFKGMWRIHGSYRAKVGDKVNGVVIKPGYRYRFVNGELTERTKR